MNIEEHESARLKVEEGARIALEAEWKAEEGHHTRMKDEEEARLVV